ncbi:MAG: S9 family peptidase [Phycisphaerales bacterium]|nr:S9 family peptidase [Phycisphaerales bacterium]
MRFSAFLLLAGTALIGGCVSAAPAQNKSSSPESPLISRSVLFGNPDRVNPQLSFDGHHLAFIAPHKGVLNVWVGATADVGSAQPITNDTKRGIRQYFWACNNKQILYVQDKDGDENWHVFATNIETNETRDLTPMEGVQARIAKISLDRPDEIVVALNKRDPQMHDLHIVNLASGEMKPWLQNDDGIVDFVLDNNFRAVAVTRFTPAGGTVVSTRGESGEWQTFAEVGPEDAMTTQVLGTDRVGIMLYMTDSRERDTAALVACNLKTSTKTFLGEDSRCDVDDVLVHPIKGYIQAIAFNHERTEWKLLDETLAADFAYLKGVCPGDFSVTSRTKDDARWIVTYVPDNAPTKYYVYERGKKVATYLFSNRKQLEDVPLATMHPVTIPARDGLKLVSYLTLPVGSGSGARPSAPLPMVLLVHGGPWARDTWGLNGTHQWLANRGYAVLSVNFRGSTGFGKKFINAANGEWGAKMHNDLLDAVEWAVKEKVADSKRVAIMGGSYGGYATLVGMTLTPDTFACGVDIVGPSSLVTLLENIPPYWMPIMPMLTTRIGADAKSETGKRYLHERSPLNFVDQIRRPLLIGQGANDPRVKQVESDQIVRAMQNKKIPVTYVLYPDEGHGFQRPQNRTSFNAVVEAFLAQHLGGRFEPIGKDFEGSTIRVPAGAEHVPGLRDAVQTAGAPG